MSEHKVDRLSTFQQLAADMLTAAQAKHGAIHTLHEGYAVLLEEVEEFWDEVRGQRPNVPNIVTELAQISAMCERIYLDVLPAILEKQAREHHPPAHE